VSPIGIGLVIFQDLVMSVDCCQLSVGKDGKDSRLDI